MVNVSKLANMLPNCQTTMTQLGRRNIPRYLYHLTTQNNYEQMLKSGYLKGAHDNNLSTNVSGIFMFDLRNFTKRWLTTGAFLLDNKVFTLAKCLIMQASKDNSKLVVLRVPTKTLSTNKLKCRSQISKNLVSDGDFATNQKHYARKKEPLEYISETDIPIQDVTKVGEVKTKFNIQKILEEIEDNKSCLNKINEKKIFRSLFKNTPEEKCINVALNSKNKKVTMLQ